MNPALQPSEQYREMAEAIVRNAPDVRDFLSKCKDCGLPAEDRIAAHEAHVEFATKFLRNFFPDATPGY